MIGVGNLFSGKNLIKYLNLNQVIIHVYVFLNSDIVMIIDELALDRALEEFVNQVEA